MAKNEIKLTLCERIKLWIRKKLCLLIMWAIGGVLTLMREEILESKGKLHNHINREFEELEASTSEQLFDLDEKINTRIDVLEKRVCDWVNNWGRRYENAEKLLKQFDGMTAHCAVDYHRHEPSWAVIHIAGKKRGYLKFINLERLNAHELMTFLNGFEYHDVDASPDVTGLVYETFFNEPKTMFDHNLHVL